MTNRSHLEALEIRLSHERVRLANARTEGERKLRAVWVAGIEREIAAELLIIGERAEPHDLDELTDDEILAELF